MKTFVLILSLNCLFSISSFSQKLTANYLVGTWNIEDSTNHLPSMSLVFKDSTHVKLLMPGEGAARLQYSLVIYNNQLVLRFCGTDRSEKKTYTYWFIKVLDNKTMEAEEPLDNPKSYEWNADLAITMIKQADKTTAMR